MTAGRKKLRSAVRRDRAESYLLTSLVSFGVTVIVTRAFLELTGYPQIGNSVLHIAHALWGGLLLFVAVLLPLALANNWAIQASALLSGIGIGLFIDEVGKFITQTNDYFFPPALPLVYGFFLLFCFGYVYFRRSRPEDPRTALYHALEGLQGALDGDLNREEAARIETQLNIARRSSQNEIVTLANAIAGVMKQEKSHWVATKTGLWRRMAARAEASGLGMGRARHRGIITVLLVLWLSIAIGFVLTLAFRVPTVDSQVIRWQTPLMIIQALVASLMAAALFDWMTGKEERGVRFAVYGFLLSLVALQTVYFYLSQFSAITATLLQLACLRVLLSYRRWYLEAHGNNLLPTIAVDH